MWILAGKIFIDFVLSYFSTSLMRGHSIVHVLLSNYSSHTHYCICTYVCAYVGGCYV